MQPVTTPPKSEVVLQFAQAVAAGLSDTPKWLPCRYLYDERGSALFEQITEQPEYYLTQTEASILEKHADDIRDVTGPMTLIELGSGSSVKTDYILRAYSKEYEYVLYVPVDVSKSALNGAEESIRERHPAIDVSGIVGQYETAFPLFEQHSPSMVIFLGSTVGNFNRSESVDFWTRVADHLASGDFFLLGADLETDVQILEAAYNDSAGVTAQFTKNIFARINRDLGARVDLDAIEHEARYNREWRRIEIYVNFLRDQKVYLEPLDQTLDISAGESVMTEISRKFVLDDLTVHVASFGFTVHRIFTDDRNYFALLLLKRDGA